jgi:hypothetical protein
MGVLREVECEEKLLPPGRSTEELLYRKEAWEARLPEAGASGLRARKQFEI